MSWLLHWIGCGVAVGMFVWVSCVSVVIFMASRYCSMILFGAGRVGSGRCWLLASIGV